VLLPGIDGMAMVYIITRCPWCSDDIDPATRSLCDAVVYALFLRPDIPLYRPFNSAVMHV
jgi:hypothetical protein